MIRFVIRCMGVDGWDILRSHPDDDLVYTPQLSSCQIDLKYRAHLMGVYDSFVEIHGR